MGREDAQAFETHIARGTPLLFWSRMPVAEIVGDGAKKTLKVSDQRFSDPLVGDRFSMFFPIGVESK
jgi:hypothetical protein